MNVSQINHAGGSGFGNSLILVDNIYALDETGCLFSRRSLINERHGHRFYLFSEELNSWIYERF